MYSDLSNRFLAEHKPLKATEIDLYEEALGQKEVEHIKELAAALQNKKWSHVSSTFTGGGVAEMLKSVLPIARGLGIDCEWHCIEGNDEFFSITKRLHNIIQGVEQKFEFQELLGTYIDINSQNFENQQISSDFTIVHDPQPCVSIVHGNYDSKVIWRCHIDTTDADKHIWNFLLPYINNYDGAVFSHRSFLKKGITTPVYQITPAIDPLAEKNRIRTKEASFKILEPLFDEYNIDHERPIVLAVSRYDIHKNQKSIIRAFKELKKDHEASSLNPQLIIVGNLADDDPEGQIMYEQIEEFIDSDPDIYALLNIPNNDENIGALMKVAQMFVHVSTREGFGLVVTEAMWQGTPVIGSNVGGITLQVLNGETGYTVEPYAVEDIATYMKHLLTDHAARSALSMRAVEHVRENFLIPTLVKKYMILMRYYLQIDVPYFKIQDF